MYFDKQTFFQHKSQLYDSLNDILNKQKKNVLDETHWLILRWDESVDESVVATYLTLYKLIDWNEISTTDETIKAVWAAAVMEVMFRPLTNYTCWLFLSSCECTT